MPWVGGAQHLPPQLGVSVLGQCGLPGARPVPRSPHQCKQAAEVWPEKQNPPPLAQRRGEGISQRAGRGDGQTAKPEARAGVRGTLKGAKKPWLHPTGCLREDRLF